MSILDDAIREHLELKRAHGADESELERLESEAFGPAERPEQVSDEVDPFAEPPTEFLSTPEPPSDGPSGGRPMPNIADLQEPPPPRPAEPETGAEDAAPQAGEEATAPEAVEPDGPAEEEHPAMEHEIFAQPAPDDRPAPPTEALQPDPDAPQGAEAPVDERPGADDQPTELFDVEAQFEDTAESASPSDEELLDAERSSEPRIAPVEPVPEDEPEDEFDEFFSEQRLSDELNQALEAPLPEESGEYDLPEDSGEQDLPEPRSPEADVSDEHEADPGHADALEDTPEFLEDEPEGDDAWFEQRPPKDFDFGD